MMLVYDKYKNTGIEFVRVIPNNWDAKRIKFGVKSLTGFAFKSNEYKNEGIKLVRGINVKEGVLNWDDTQFWDVVTPILKKYFLSAGDVLIQMDGSKVGKNYCIVKAEDLPLLLLQRVTRLRTNKNLNANFLFYTIAAQRFFNWVSISKTDPLVPHITLKDIENYVIALPPLSEQTAIAQYLDAKTMAIDKKINLLTKKADYYKELRKSIINDAVCKGLDKNVKLKESGMEWIGKIPQHWEVKRLKDVFKFSKGKNASKYNQDFVNDIKNQGEYPVYSGQTENDGLMAMINLYEYNLSKKAILVSTVGAKAMEVKMLSGKFTLSQNCALIEILKLKDSPDFFFYFLTQLFREERKIIPTIMQPSLRIEDLVKYFLLVPPKEEQTAIANYLDEKTQKIDAIVSNIGKQIDTLKELRKTLINDVVTGKIKVVNN